MIMQKIVEKIKSKKIKLEKKLKINYSINKTPSEIKPNILSTKSSKYNLSTKNSLNNSCCPKNKNPKLTSIKHIKIMKQKLMKSLSESRLFGDHLNNIKTKFLKKKEQSKDSKLEESLKTSREMTDKFYIKNREALKGIGKTNSLYSGYIKDPIKIINKIMNDYKNINIDNKELLLNIQNSYKRNLEYLQKYEILKENEKKLENELFEKMKKQKIKNKTPLINYMSMSKSCSPIQFSIMKLKINKQPSLPEEYYLEGGNRLERYTSMCINNNRKLVKKQIKKNAIKCCRAVSQIDFHCKPCEPINEETCKYNLRKNIIYNRPNFVRLTKIENILQKGLGEEEYEAIKSIKNFKKYDNYALKVASGFLPRFAKKNNFSNLTIERYNDYQGKTFGLEHK